MRYDVRLYDLIEKGRDGLHTYSFQTHQKYVRGRRNWNYFLAGGVTVLALISFWNFMAFQPESTALQRFNDFELFEAMVGCAFILLCQWVFGRTQKPIEDRKFFQNYVTAMLLLFAGRLTLVQWFTAWPEWMLSFLWTLFAYLFGVLYLYAVMAVINRWSSFYPEFLRKQKKDIVVRK